MKNKIFAKFLCVILSLTCIFSLCALLASCNNGGYDENTDGDTPKGNINYTVKLVDYAGSPISDVVVHVLKNGQQVKMNVTGPTGVAKFSLEAGDYTVAFESADEDKTFAYDEAKCVLSANNPEITVTLYNGLKESGSIMFTVNDVDTEFKTYALDAGESFVNISEGGTSYFIFTPTKQGLYKISSSDHSVKVGYHGAPTFPQLNNIADMNEDLSFYFNVKDSHIGTSGTGTSQYIISAENIGETAISCIIKVEREGDYIKDVTDEPWTDVMPTNKLEKYVPEAPLSENMLTNLDITNAGLTVVFNENDGYYHLGSADGPLVLVRISSESDYIASFTEICETDRLAAYFYDENEKFVKKESFNKLIAKYAEICDEVTGVCPLDKDLEYMIKTVGEYKGWWNYEAGTQIFANIVVPIQNAWLFACCYVSQ